MKRHVIFDGRKFSRAPTVVMIKPDPEKPYMIRFGRLIPDGTVNPNAVESQSKWISTGNPVLAIPVKLKGHSLTNMAYGADGRIYLAHDGVCYTTRRK